MRKLLVGEEYFGNQVEYRRRKQEIQVRLAPALAQPRPGEAEQGRRAEAGAATGYRRPALFTNSQPDTKLGASCIRLAWRGMRWQDNPPPPHLARSKTYYARLRRDLEMRLCDSRQQTAPTCPQRKKNK